MAQITAYISFNLESVGLTAEELVAKLTEHCGYMWDIDKVYVPNNTYDWGRVYFDVDEDPVTTEEVQKVKELLEELEGDDHA